jgi:serine phosphatase RsbU (regulator of sigma subunit)
MVRWPNCQETDRSSVSMAARSSAISGVLWLPGSHLYLFSDGLYEVRTGDSAMLPWDDFIGLLLAHHHECSTAPHCLSPIRRIVDAVKGLSGKDIFDDDVSIVEFAFNG